jgi:hypothetical protein
MPCPCHLLHLLRHPLVLSDLLIPASSRSLAPVRWSRKPQPIALRRLLHEPAPLHMAPVRSHLRPLSHRTISLLWRPANPVRSLRTPLLLRRARQRPSNTVRAIISTSRPWSMVPTSRIAQLLSGWPVALHNMDTTLLHRRPRADRCHRWPTSGGLTLLH